jgi:hypothetical protein
MLYSFVRKHPSRLFVDLGSKDVACPLLVLQAVNIFVACIEIINCSGSQSGSRYSDWLGAGRPRSRSSSPCSVKNFLFSTSSRPALGPPSFPSPGVKRPEREADHSPPASAEVKKMWINISNPPYVFMA